MTLLVGLGNPGDRYARNRHNVGFMAADEIHEAFGFGPWKKKFQSEISEGKVPGIEGKVVLLKPQTFMNLSGNAVQAALQFYKIPLAAVYVFHDELDLAPCKIKIKQGGGSGGHNGLKSIDACCGAAYWRVRLGIGHPGVHSPDKADQVSSYVLSDFAKAERTDVEALLQKVAKHLPVLLSRGSADFLNAMAIQPEKD